MKNEKLQSIIDTCGNKSNKELANTLLTLNHDFENIKKVILELTETMGEVEVAYNTVHEELKKRLNVKD